MLYYTNFTKFFCKKTYTILLLTLFFISLQIDDINAASPKELNFTTPPLVLLNDQAAKKQMLALNKERMGIESWTELEPALQNALTYSRAKDQSKSAIEHKHLPWSEVTASLELLLKLLPRLDKEPELLVKYFKWFKLNPPSHFTGYYSPVIRASMTKKEGFTIPLYRLPDELAPELAHCLGTHTCPDSAFTTVIRPDPPTFSREQIDLDKALAGRGLEIAWLEHPFDTYSLMLQGSGYLDFDTGQDRAILFAGLNGHRGESMAGYLMRTKNVAKRDATMGGMREWWDKNPNKRRDFLKASSGYVFFRYGPYEPQGTIGGDLVPWVSMAVDPRVLPLGGIMAYYIPTKGKTKAGHTASKNNNYIQGLGFAHDTGGAIQINRIDMYAGKGQEGHDKAMSIYNKGQIWLLLKK